MRRRSGALPLSSPLSVSTNQSWRQGFSAALWTVPVCGAGAAQRSTGPGLSRRAGRSSAASPRQGANCSAIAERGPPAQLEAVAGRSVVHRVRVRSTVGCGVTTRPRQTVRGGGLFTTHLQFIAELQLLLLQLPDAHIRMGRLALSHLHQILEDLGPGVLRVVLSQKLLQLLWTERRDLGSTAPPPTYPRNGATLVRLRLVRKWSRGKWTEQTKQNGKNPGWSGSVPSPLSWVLWPFWGPTRGAYEGAYRGAYRGASGRPCAPDRASVFFSPLAVPSVMGECGLRLWRSVARRRRVLLGTPTVARNIACEPTGQSCTELDAAGSNSHAFSEGNTQRPGKQTLVNFVCSAPSTNGNSAWMCSCSFWFTR